MPSAETDPPGAVPVHGGTGPTSQEWHTLMTLLHPPERKRKPRRRLRAGEKHYVCGIDGCSKAYGSASSLCSHRRIHHPGSKPNAHSPSDPPEGADEDAGASKRKRRADDLADDESSGPEEDDSGDPEADSPPSGGGSEGGSGRPEDAAPVGEGYVHYRRPGRPPGSTRAPALPSLTAEQRARPAGQWLELLAADTQGRLGALRRSRQCVPRPSIPTHP